jgi:hypothetical protein
MEKIQEERELEVVVGKIEGRSREMQVPGKK